MSCRCPGPCHTPHRMRPAPPETAQLMAVEHSESHDTTRPQASTYNDVSASLLRYPQANECLATSGVCPSRVLQTVSIVSNNAEALAGCGTSGGCLGCVNVGAADAYPRQTHEIVVRVRLRAQQRAIQHLQGTLGSNP
jgi:hypothetical protein